ncbi:hypothetical protein [Sporosarcina sp. NPDC096371]
MGISHTNRKKSEVIWTVLGLTFGAALGALLGIIAYNQQWLG